MGKITLATSPMETTQELDQDTSDGIYFELPSENQVTTPHGLTPFYDEEIGLWEELELRQTKSELLLKIPQ